MVALLTLAAVEAGAEPPVPSGLQPADGTTLTTRGVELSWSAVTDPGAQPVHYEVVVYRPDAPTELVAGALSIDPHGAVSQDGYALLVTPLESVADVASAGGAATAGVTFPAGRHGQAVLVAGSDSVSFPTSGSFDPTRGTIEMAVNLNRDIAAFEGYDRFFTYRIDDSEQLSMLVTPDLDAVYGHVMHEGLQHNALHEVSWEAGAWHHLAFTWGPEGQRLYADGDLVASNPSAVTASVGADRIFVGNDDQGWGGIDALIDDLRISSTQRRSPDELRATHTGELFLEGATYAWKVRAVAPGDPGPWSEPSTFTVDPSGPRSVALTGDVLQEDFGGFGAEWDAMFWQSFNTAAGVDEADFDLVAQRMEALRLSMVRMFVQVSWWEATKGRQDFESRELTSLYHQLEVCQGLDIDVNLVIWRPAGWVIGWTNDMEGLARSTADLLEELERRGLTAVKYLTIINEPNLELGEPFSDYVLLLETVAAELAERELEVLLVGPDESGGFDWFERATEDLAETVEVFSSHTYQFDLDSIGGIDDFVSDRLELMSGAPPADTKPLYVMEFGSSNNIDSFHSADIDTFERALFSAVGALRAMRAGAAGVLHWCLHDVYYAPGMKMGYGLWRFKDEDWEPRPIFHAWGLLSGLAPRGSEVLGMTQADPRLFSTAVRQPDGSLVVWAANLDSAPMDITLDLSAGDPAASSVSWYRFEEEAWTATAELLVPAGSLDLDAGVTAHTLPPNSLTAYFAEGPPIQPAEPDDPAESASDAGGTGDEDPPTGTDGPGDDAPTADRASLEDQHLETGGGPDGTGSSDCGCHVGTAPDGSGWVMLGVLAWCRRRKCQ